MRKGSIKKQNGVHASTPHIHTLNTHSLTTAHTKADMQFMNSFLLAGQNARLKLTKCSKPKPSQAATFTATLTKAVGTAAAKTESGSKKKKQIIPLVLPVPLARRAKTKRKRSSGE